MRAAFVRRLGTELHLLVRGATHRHRLLRSRLAFLLVSTLLLDAVATGLMYAFEHARSDSGFDDLGGALFWVLPGAPQPGGIRGVARIPPLPSVGTTRTGTPLWWGTKQPTRSRTRCALVPARRSGTTAASSSLRQA